MVWKKKADIRGPRGHSIDAARLGIDDHLRFDRSDGATFDVGDVRGPQGLPGAAELPTDDAVAEYISTEGTSATKAALEQYRPDGGGKPVGKGEIVLRPEDFGAVGDNTADDTAALAMCFRIARDNSKRRYVVWLEGMYRITSTLTWDVYNTSVSGQGQITSAINDASKYMIQTISSDPGDISSPVRQRATTWAGVVLYGDNNTGLMQISGQSFGDKPAHVNFHRATFTRGGVGIRFGRNAYMITFLACNISLCRTGLLHDDAENSGERLEFIGCDITGHGTAYRIASGQAMHFLSCSFSYVLRRMGEITSGQAFHIANHFEFGAPYADSWLLSGGGAYVGAIDSRWLIRDPENVITALTLPKDGNTVGWSENTRSRWASGDPVKFVGLSGVTGIDGNTTYYLLNVSESGFRVATSPGGSPISWTGTGTATGLAPQTNAAIFNLGHASASATIRDGSFHGSASGLKTLSTGVGAFEISGTSTFAASPLALRSRVGGELRDALFATAGTFLDDWELSDTSVGSLSTTSDSLSGTNSLIVTKTAGGGLFLDLWVPLSAMSRLRWTFNYKKASSSTLTHLGYFSTRRLPRGASSSLLGGQLWSSNLTAAAGTWTPFTQTGRSDRRSPSWAKYVLLRWSLGNLATGETFQVDLPEPSLL